MSKQENEKNPLHRCRYCGLEGRAGPGQPLRCEVNNGSNMRHWACRDAESCGKRLWAQNAFRASPADAVDDLPF
jgi:hypothetical protein